MPVEPPFQTYREQLWSLYQGLPLWEPNPGGLYDRVSIGDVGYVSEGAFIRMFNVRLPWDDESNRRFGIPDRYDPLAFDDLSIRRDTFDEVDHYSRFVSSVESDYIQATSPGQVAYSCRGRGALLSLPHGGRREDAVQTKIFEKYIQDNVASWFIWAQKNQLGVERMEDLILVSGCTLVTKWAAAVFTPDNTMSASITLESRTHVNGGPSFVWSNIQGPVAHHSSRFDPIRSPGCCVINDGCVFIKGFRARRVLFWIKPLRATAEPLPDNPDNRRDGNIEVTLVPDVPEYRDPLIGVLDYIAKKCMAEDIMAIAHDDDLQFIEDMKTLTADEIEKDLFERNIPLLIENSAAILRVPRNNTSLVTNEEQATSSTYGAAESNVESSTLVSHPVLTNYHIKPEMTDYIKRDHELPNISLIESSSDPVRDLNNYLQVVKQGQNLAPYLSFSSQQTGLNNRAIHVGIYTFRGVTIGTGKGISKSAAKQNAAAQALEYFRENGIPE